MFSEFFIDTYNLNIREFHDNLNKSQNIDTRRFFYTRLTADVRCIIQVFSTVNNNIVYTGETLNILNGKDLYLTILRKYKSWSLQIYSTVGQTTSLYDNCTDLVDTLYNFLNERQKQIQRIYEDYFINFSPIENTSVFNKETTTYSGNEKTTTTNSGSKTSLTATMLTECPLMMTQTMLCLLRKSLRNSAGILTLRMSQLPG